MNTQLKYSLNVRIRSERSTDYASIANVNYEAFSSWHRDNQYVSEPVLVDLLRHNSGFNTQLSLVAEVSRKVVGYALFSPFKFIVQGKAETGVVLAPIAVHPDYQKCGIGEMLIEEGHERTRELGFSFSLLCGHEDYYPRFGYIPCMFAIEGTKVSVNAESFNTNDYLIRPVYEKDLPWITEKWYNRNRNTQLSLFPGENICEWRSHGLNTRCSVIVKRGENIGYVRYDLKQPCLKELLADDEYIEEIIKLLITMQNNSPRGEIHTTLPYEYLMRVCHNSEHIRLVDEQAAFNNCMIMVLRDHSSISDYCEKVHACAVKPGIVVFPPMFDVDEGRED